MKKIDPNKIWSGPPQRFIDPWTEWDDYTQCYGCKECGAAEGYRIHNPGCTYTPKLSFWDRLRMLAIRLQWWIKGL